MIESREMTIEVLGERRATYRRIILGVGAVVLVVIGILVSVVVGERLRYEEKRSIAWRQLHRAGCMSHIGQAGIDFSFTKPEISESDLKKVLGHLTIIHRTSPINSLEIGNIDIPAELLNQFRTELQGTEFIFAGVE